MAEFHKKWSFKEAPKEFTEVLLWIDRVTRVTAGWRQLRFRASVVIWNMKWTIGLWVGKAWEVVVAIEKAVRDAKKNLIKFEIDNWTIAHDIEAKFKAASVMLHPASEWTWIIAGWAIRKVLSVSGIKDILAKRYGSTSWITNALATIKALWMIKPAKKVAKKEEVVVEAPVKAEAPIKKEEKKVEVKEEVKETKKEEKIAVKAPAKKAPAKKPAAKKTPAKK